MIVTKPAARLTRRFALGVGVALVAAALVPATASAAKLWDGKWKYHVEGGGVGKMCLDQQGDYVEGKFQSSDPGKHGVIWGDLSHRGTAWDGKYKDKGTGDRGSFSVSLAEGGGFEGYFDSRSGGSYRWRGHQVDFDGSYDKCVRQIKD